MAIIQSYKNKHPRWGNNCLLCDNAAIVGDVVLGDDCSVWFNAVIRADVNYVRIGDRTNIQDGACIHVSGGEGHTDIGNDVSIGHNATVHGCRILDGALIGMGATVLDGAVVGEGAIVAAGAVVLQHSQIGPHEIWAGVPAKFVKHTRPEQAENYAKAYVGYKDEYLRETAAMPMKIENNDLQSKK
ncbi:MAG: gamma carbonic anhydrase family protein [Prevotella sp.]|jgi:carbonic anhydrase/acetyltransferase-like protein (isoleucine patch superfamily)